MFPRTYFSSTYFSPTYFPGPSFAEIQSSLITAIIARLKSVPELSRLTGIYKNKPPRRWQFPYMIITLINGNDDIFAGLNYEIWGRREFQFSVISSDDEQAEILGEIAYKALLPTTGSLNPKLTWMDVDQGYEIIRWPLYHWRMGEMPNRGPNNQNVWKYDFGYRFEIGSVPIVPSQFL
jgi:hypothetical protein